MKQSKIQSFFQQHRTQVVLVLLVLALTVGFAYWRTSSYKPRALSSKAGNEIPPAHWPHSEAPFKLPLLNSSTKYWNKHLAQKIANWEQAPAVKFDTIKGNNSEPCSFYPEMINFCTFNDPDSFLIAGGTILYNDIGHIITAAFTMNDGLLNNPRSDLNTPAYRNKFLCLYLGFSIGMDLREGAPPKVQSCMLGASTPDDIRYQQNPDQLDLDILKALYHDHFDNTMSSGGAYKTAEMGPLTFNGDIGSLVKIRDNGQVEIYQKDLGQGITQVTFLQKIGSEK